MLELHNRLRAAHNEAPLVWSSELAAEAQRWADHLLHGSTLAHGGDKGHGQNLFFISGLRTTPEFVFEQWASEASDYNRSANTCSNMCGHYTQIVWRNTKQVGCAIARAGSQEVWVCDYDPPGNVVGKRPY